MSGTTARQGKKGEGVLWLAREGSLAEAGSRRWQVRAAAGSPVGP
jgi:hypothetical protein